MTEVLQTPIKSPNDKNLYRLIKLENGLKALLIQHKSPEQHAAMAINVDVGGLDDPQNSRGLSHFVEHMLFMGSEKYPKENEIDEFIKENGGNSNAFTSYKDTTYHFEIKEDALENAVDRFSSIFLSPLMSENSIEREVQAVESEFKNRINDNNFKFWQLFYENCNEDFKAFIVGNSKTLQEGRSNSELYQLVHEHRRKFYVSNRITLAIESSKSLDDLQKMIENYFNGVQSGQARAEIPQDEYTKIFKPQFSDTLTYMKPKNESKMFFIYFPLPESETNYKSMPVEYLQYLTGNNFQGGLRTFLKNKSLITGFFTQSYSGEFGSIPLIADFFCGAHLTEHGSKNIPKVLEAIYSYLLLIKETSLERHRELFEEWTKINKINFEFMESQDSITNVKSFVLDLRLCEDIDILRSPYYALEFDGENLKKYIDLLNESNFHISIIDHELEVEYDKIEEFYGTEYKEVEVPEEYRRLWNERRINEELSLPPKNDFISSNFDIYADNEEVEKMEHPLKIFENDVAESWYKIDSTHKVPKVFIGIKMDSPLTIESASNFVLAETFLDMANDSLRIKYASALQAKFSTNIFMLENSIRLHFSGYSEKMEKFVQSVMEDLKNVEQFLDESKFKVFKERSIRNRKKYLIENNFKQSVFNSLVTKNLTSVYDQYHAVKEIKFGDLENFAQKLFGNLKIQILVQGNFLKNQAMNVTKIVLQNIGASPVEDPTSIDSLNYQLPVGKTSIKIKSFSKSEKNSIAEEVFDLGDRTARNEVLGLLLYKIVNVPFFDILRTKEQLGYAIYAIFDRKPHAFYLKLFIKHQEDKFSSKFISQRLKKFVNQDSKEIMKSLSDEKFKSIQDGIIFDLLSPFTKLSDEVNFNMRRIVDESYIYDLNEKQADICKSITKEELIQFYRKAFVENSPRNLTFQIVGNAAISEDEENESVIMNFASEKYNDDENVVTDLKTFKDSLQTMPKYHREDII